MNQSADFVQNLNGIVASSISPYQKVEDYPKIKQLKDLTYLLSESKPTAWTTSLERFEGEGGLQSPDGVNQAQLDSTGTHYQMPAAVMQFDVELSENESFDNKFIFGPANNKVEIESIKQQYISAQKAVHDDNYLAYIANSKGCLTVDSEQPL